MDIISDVNRKDNFLDVILNTVSDGITLIDKELKIQYQNKIISQLFGSGPGEYCFEVYRGRKTPCENCVVIEVLKDGKERRAVVDIELSDGGMRLMEVSSAPIKDENGNITVAVEVARDVTDQKKAEVLLNKTLLEQTEDLKRLNNEISDAAGYVKAVLPKAIISGTLITNWKFIPSASLGGDSFGYHWIDDNHFAVYLLDVSGHGRGAALLSVSVINVLRSLALPKTDFCDPQQVLTSLNKAFPGGQHNDMFFTIWYGVYDKSSEQLVYSSGGHPPALLFSRSDSNQIRMEQLRTPNFIMGGKQDVDYQSKIQEINRPSRLYVFSDGVYDITKKDGSIWGINKFMEFSLQSFNMEQSNLDFLLSYTEELAQKKEFDDDFTILEIAFE
ncbi:MAG: SpoIIE family protein phosphatase [Desulfobacterales bacterium]|jgi:serine phosphatase RsbU (regulator of sigma subunit)